ASGAAVLSSFNLAWRREQTPEESRGEIRGTPGYMAPEQAAGDTVAFGPATDVHALGVVLYELLTGRLPYQGGNVLEVLMSVIQTEPLPPRHWQPALPEALEEITLKCLQKDPGRRYRRAGDLADDLNRFLNGEPISCARRGFWGFLRSWWRRAPEPPPPLPCPASSDDQSTQHHCITMPCRSASEAAGYRESIALATAFLAEGNEDAARV